MSTLPPGLHGSIAEVSSGGCVEWLTVSKQKPYTNAFITHEGKVLLGYKKRGYGKGLYSGFGGKVDAGESPAEAAVRELKEEAGIDAPLEHRGTLLFVCDDVEWAFHIDIFRADRFTGDVIETEEMRPQWFVFAEDTESDSSLPTVPWDQMWGSDPFLYPLLFSKQRFVGRTDFVANGADGYVLQRWWFGVPVPDSNVLGVA